MIQQLESSASPPLSSYEMIQKIDCEIARLQTQEGQASSEAIGVNPHKFQRLLKATRSNLLGSCEQDL